MSHVVYLNEARVSIFTAKPEQSLMLRPGRNIVDSDLLKEVQKHSKEFRDHCEKEIIVITGDGIDITKLSVPKAIKMIDLEATTETVQELLTQEEASEKPRKNVVDAAVAKLELLREADKQPKETVANVKPKSSDGGNN